MMALVALSIVICSLFFLAVKCDPSIPDYVIYVNPSNGIMTSNCWKGYQQTPCSSIAYAIQGAAHHSKNSLIYIYISSGIHLLNVTSNITDQLTGFNGSISVIGSSIDQQVSTVVNLNDFSFNKYNIDLQCITLYQYCTTAGVPLVAPCYKECWASLNFDISLINRFVGIPLYSNYYSINPAVLYFIASTSVLDCYYRAHDVYTVRVCIVSANTSNEDEGAVTVSLTDYDSAFGGTQCQSVKTYDDINEPSAVGFFTSYSMTNPINVNISITAFESITTYATVTLLPCGKNMLITDYYDNDNEEKGRALCQGTLYSRLTITTCGNYYKFKIQPNYCIDKTGIGAICPSQYANDETVFNIKQIISNSTSFCAENREGRLCGSCSDGYGVPINILNKCVDCPHYPLGILVFILIELLPITVMVCLIIVFNIQLTNGSINGLVFYSQILTTVYPGLALNAMIMYQGRAPNSQSVALSCFDLLPNNSQDDFPQYYNYWLLFLIPFNIFNLDFTPVLYNYPLCVTPNMSPLGAISFWYLIAFYPLMLLFFIYIWTVLYFKGFKCVVFVTRPFHRCLRRFWSMTDIVPSFAHSIASVYLLCFTQIIAISFKLLQYTNIEGRSYFSYDATVKYFDGFYGFVCFVALMILIFVIFLPYFYIQFYPLKPFHKLLKCLRLNNRQILISLGDVFTGSYKNGTDNVFDYRYYAGFYLLMRILIVFIHLFSTPPIYTPTFTQIPIAFQLAVFVLMGGSIMIFRPYKGVIHNFSEFLLFFCLSSVDSAALVSNFVSTPSPLTVTAFSFINVIILCIIGIYLLVKLCKFCRKSFKSHQSRRKLLLEAHRAGNNSLNDVTQLETDFVPIVDDNWLPDRIENPSNYMEKHVQVTEADALLMLKNQPN